MSAFMIVCLSVLHRVPFLHFGVLIWRLDHFSICSRRSFKFGFACLCIANPHQGYLRLSRPPSDQGAGGGARTRDGIFLANLKACSPSIVAYNSRRFSLSAKRNKLF
ncbi:hypothetical protein PoB_001587600 [Plakobranchus ocellatus]|uniref:Secreted protein n=1 Tax=Plakobranchus ocellatus TaxID=259542 RepID=A0AAV3Z0M9_9GAST|nr:hypothetical protein PoB_001587600 [Plakobranchus ocellatus]